MTSTRNKNTRGNYCLEQRQYTNAAVHSLYVNSSSGEAWDTKLAGDGVLQGAMPSTKLSTNSADIESFLFGIGTTNLVDPMTSFTPELTENGSRDFFTKAPTYIPEPLVVEKFQRPGYLP